MAQVEVLDMLAQILQTLIEQQRSFAEQQDRKAATQARLLAEQARQAEAQALMFQKMRQHKEAVRLQLFQEQQQQQLQYFSGYFGALYSHVGLAPPPPAPLLPSDPAALKGSMDQEGG